jgi:biopolymer transport protein ExbD
MHGGGGNNSADPNLVPLLDLVLQLIMFFIMVVNFVTEQVNKGISLPTAQTARPMDNKKGTGALFLNMDHKGHLTVLDQPKPLVTIPEIRLYLQTAYQDAKRLADNLGEKEVGVVVVVRADQLCDYAYVYHMLRMCKEAGFRRLQLRAEVKPN